MLLSANDIIHKSVDLYKQNIQLFFRYMIALFIPTAVLSVASIYITTTNQLVALVLSIIMIAAAVAALWISLSFIQIIANRYEGKETMTMVDELKHTQKKIIPSILVSLLTAIAVIVGFVLFIIPSIIFMVWFSFVLHEIVLENKKTIEAMKASKALVTGRWAAVLWRLIAPAVIFTLLTFIIQGILSFPTFFISENPSLIGMLINTFIILVTSAVSVLVTPLSTAAPTILYLELKKTPVVPQKMI